MAVLTWLPGDMSQKSDGTSDRERAEIPQPHQPLLKREILLEGRLS